MIVKTGANYQAEGGYIEASREGDIISIDGTEYNNKYGVHSMAKLVIDNRTSSDFNIWAGMYGSHTKPPAYYQRTATAHSRTEWEVFINQTVVCSRGGIVLSDESVGCEVAGDDSTYIHVTAVDAVAVVIH